jgi:hypothetical protein
LDSVLSRPLKRPYLVLDSREVVAIVLDPWILYSQDLLNVHVLDSREVVAMVSNPWILYSQDLLNVRVLDNREVVAMVSNP